MLTSAREIILSSRPTLLVEVLPEAQRLGQVLATLARDGGYVISIIPEYGSDKIVTVAPEEFTARLPQRYNSKDVVLSTIPLNV